MRIMLSWHGLDEFFSSDTDWSNPQQKFLHKHMFSQLHTDIPQITFIVKMSCVSHDFTLFASTSDHIQRVSAPLSSKTFHWTSAPHIYPTHRNDNMLKLMLYEHTLCSDNRFIQLRIFITKHSRDAFFFSFVLIHTTLLISASTPYSFWIYSCILHPQRFSSESIY